MYSTKGNMNSALTLATNYINPSKITLHQHFWFVFPAEYSFDYF